jgi:hypothetical protein
MKRVYLLGAGASHDLYFRHSISDLHNSTSQIKDFKLNGPLSSGFFYYCHQLFSEMKNFSSNIWIPSLGNPLISFIQTWYQNKYIISIKREDIWQNEKISKNINIENLFIDLEDAISNANSTVAAAYISIDQYIFDSIAGMCYYCISQKHKELAELITQHPNDHVISFNWDTLLEEAMFHTRKWSYRDGYGLQFADINYFDDEDKKEKQYVQDIISHNLIIKPHGSINWYRKREIPDQIILGLQLQDINLRGGTSMMQNSGITIGSEFYPSGVIPPGKKRKEYPLLWTRMNEILEQADEIVAIGFSFNGNDIHIRSYFTDVEFKSSLKIILVNPDPNLKSIYQEIFQTKNINQYFDIDAFLGNA